MKFHRNLLLFILTALFTFTLGWDIWLYTLPEHTTKWNYYYNILFGAIFFIGGMISIAYSTQFSLKSNLGRMLLFLGLGLLSFWGGSMIWVYYTLFLNVSVPYPSLADLSYCLVYPCMAIGTIYLLRIYHTLITKELIRDSIIIIILSFAVIFGFFARPDISAELPFIQRLANVYFPVGDVIVLSIALIAIRANGKKTHPSLYILAFGLAMQAMGDILFTYRAAVGTYWNGDIADLFYTLSAYFTSVGIIEIIHSLNQATTTGESTLADAAQPIQRPK